MSWKYYSKRIVQSCMTIIKTADRTKMYKQNYMMSYVFATLVTNCPWVKYTELSNW